MTDEQLAFNVEGMFHKAAITAAPERSGVPLTFRIDYCSPAALDAAF